MLDQMNDDDGTPFLYEALTLSKKDQVTVSEHKVKGSKDEYFVYKCMSTYYGRVIRQDHGNFFMVSGVYQSIHV